jgi:alpha-beta hydrolase superfamily lysophospholipase
MAEVQAGPEVRVIHEDVSFLSNDGKSTCVGDVWYPAQGEVRCVVQIVHGMVEHLLRYEDVALAFVEQGYAVCGIDHIGHGRTCPDPDKRGIYDPKLGASQMIEDQQKLRVRMQERFAGIPYVLLGHSMGSFVTRCYIARHGEGLAGAIVMGTGWQSGATLKAGKLLARVIACFHGWGHYSPMIDGIGVGGYNKAFEGTGAKTGVEWLSRDPQRAIDYVADPDSGWHFSVSGYYVLFSLLQEAEDPKLIARIPKDLPVLVISGADDPVGAQGKGPTYEFNALKDAGVTDVELQLYDGARHEVLGETNKEEVMGDLVAWIEGHAIAR